MLVYIIDAFNLIHKIKSLKQSSFPQRELIHFIRNNKLTGSSTNKVIVVFDGSDPSDLTACERNYEIIFSYDRKADDYIKQRARKIKNKSEVIVVSDDRDIRSFVRQIGARSLQTADFIKTKVTKQTKRTINENEKDISYTLQREITEEMRKIWLSDSDRD